jgi:hypothetical protein
MSQIRTPRRRRFFTPEEANRTLPLVRAIVKDVVEAARQVRAAATELGRNLRGTERESRQQELVVQRDRFEALLRELNDLGIELKDTERGLVDFPAKHQGRNVLICWHLGEERIGFWHELTDGFAGRKPISALHPAADRGESMPGTA